MSRLYSHGSLLSVEDINVVKLLSASNNNLIKNYCADKKKLL